MSIKNKVLSRTGSLIGATLVALGALVPAVVPMVSAAGQVQTRSIQMSDSTPGQTGVAYTVSFTPATANADSMVIDFCNNGSIIGSSCTAPTAMDANASIGFSTSDAQLTSGKWALGTGALATANRVILKDASGTGANKLTTSAITFDLTGIKNSTDTGTFWARVYTYNDDSYGGTGTAYTAANALGDYVDYGGFALSTVPLINITATVMETLTFCINKTTISAACASLTPGVSLTLGTGTPKVLSTTSGTGSSDDAFFQVSTNALTGVVVKMKTHNTCSGLSRDGGTDGCPVAGIGATASPLTTANQALFGVNVAADTPLGSTLGTFTADSPYNTSNYAMDTTSGNDVTSGGGTDLAHTPSAAADLGGHLTFDAEAAATTPAGVYTADESLIATGTF